MSNAKCPKCGGELTVKVVSGVPILQCYSCGFSMNTKTGLETRFDPKDNGCVLACGKCGGKIRATGGLKIGDYVTCPACGADSRITDRPDPNLFSIVTCPVCSGKNRVPANRGRIKVTCGHCEGQYFYESGIWPSERREKTAAQPQQRPTSNTQQRPASNTQQRPASNAQQRPAGNAQQRPASDARQQTTTVRAEAPCRTVSINRLTHAYKEWDLHGLKNRFMDNYPVHIFLDDVDQGLLPKGEEMVLSIDSDAHVLKSAVFASAYGIPAGREDYLAFFFNGGFRIGFKNDTFREELAEFVLRMFRGQGIRDRIRDENNRNHNIVLNIGQEGIRLSWSLAQTKGLRQWATGEDEEKISYRQIGLTPPALEEQPGGYWQFIQDYVEDLILKDKEADMDRYMGGFTFRTKHNLY